MGTDAYKFSWLGTIEGITAEGQYDASDQVAQYAYFTNDSSRVIEHITEATDNLVKRFGEDSLRTLTRSRALVVRPLRLNVAGKIPTSQLGEMGMSFFNLINTLTLSLWLVKDSAASTGDIYVFANSKALTKNPCQMSSAYNGGIDKTVFTKAEIGHAVGYMKKLVGSSKRQESALTQADFENEPLSLLRADLSRMRRVLLMLQVVRQSHDVALKIAHYCSCFEILFGSAGAESVAHQLSQRIAFFIGASPVERMKIYNEVREAYRVRCEIFHGRFLKPQRLTKLEQVSLVCDRLLRTVLRRILESPECAALFEESSQNFDTYFDELTFGFYERAHAPGSTH